MNKAQLIDALASKFDGNRRSASSALEAVIDTVTRTVVTGEKVGITGFGVFEKLDKPARTVRNPATGASVKKKKTSVPRFRPGAEFKAYVSGEKKFARVPAVKKAAVKATAVKAAPAAAPARKTAAAVKAAPETTAAVKAPAKRATRTAAAPAATTPTPAVKAAPVKRARKTPAAVPAKTAAPAKTTEAAVKTTPRKTAATPATPAKRAARKA